MVTNISDKKLKGIIKESVREVFDASLMKLRAFALPHVSDKEQKDIEKQYGKPSREKAKSYSLDI